MNASLDSALLAIASISAVVWTGGLIVLQLRASPFDLPGGQQTKEAMAFYKTSAERIQAGMACAAFGFLVPAAELAFHGWWLRFCFAISAAYYVRNTADAPDIIRQTMRAKNWEWVMINVYYLYPTLALVSVFVFPYRPIVAFLSLLALFLSYNMLAATLMAMTRKNPLNL